MSSETAKKEMGKLAEDFLQEAERFDFEDRANLVAIIKKGLIQKSEDLIKDREEDLARSEKAIASAKEQTENLREV